MEGGPTIWALPPFGRREVHRVATFFSWGPGLTGGRVSASKLLASSPVHKLEQFSDTLAADPSFSFLSV